MIPVTVTSPGVLRVTPTELVLSDGGGGAAETRRLKPPQQTGEMTRLLAVRAAAGGKAFHVLRVELPTPEITAEVKPSADTRSAFITLRGLRNFRQLDGSHIRIITDDPASPELKIPIHYKP